MTSLAGRVVLVTGAARRIGRGIVERLEQEGARVAVHYNTSEAEARTAGAAVFQADLARVSEIERLFAEVESHFGGLDALVNNAARWDRADPLELTEAQWDAIVDVNLKATFFCCQQAARRMLKRGGGRIVNISSLGGLRAWPEHAHYCASKAGVIHLTRALAQAWAPYISVNSVAPGVIPFGEEDDRIRRFIERTPAGRAGTADEIADAVVFFLTASEFVTGQVLAVDGGLSLK